MFQEWRFLIAEIWLLLVLAVLLGLVAGWLIRARSGAATATARVQRELERLQTAALGHDDRIAAMQAELSRARTEAAALAAKVKAAEKLRAFPAGEALPGPQVKPADTARLPSPGPAPTPGDTPEQQPQMRAAPRDGGADDLKRISGIGPKIERMLNQLGVWHFDQIAGWSEAEISWVDSHLDGFKGRIRRDGWVAQARTLAEKPPAGA